MREVCSRSRWRTALAAGVGVAALAAAVPMTAGAAAAAGPDPADVPMVALGDVRLVEGDVGRRVARVPITLSRPLDGDAYFTVETVASDKSATPDVDYKPVVKQVRIRAGTTFRSVGIRIFGDTEAEETEVVDVKISPLDTPWVGFSKPTGSVIVDDDDTDGPGGPTVSVGSVRMFEGNSGKSRVEFALTLSEPQASDVFVTWHTDGGTATPDVDYKKVSSKTTRIPAGRVHKRLPVQVYGDTTVEPNDDVSVLIDAVTGSGVEVFFGRGVVFIVDDDGDDDGDGLVNSAEASYKTDPNDPDTDGDGLSDLDEVLVTLTNPNQADTDADGLDDLYELKVSGTDPLVADTDGDGYTDGVEVAAGSDPLDPADYPK